MKKWSIGIILGLLVFTFTTQAQAKWWLFGRTEGIPEITEVYIGNIEVSAVSPGETLYLDQSNLEGSNLLIKGFARKGDAALAMAKVSLDNGSTWENVNIIKDGFIYQFSPEDGKEYKLQFSVIDSTGKKNDPRDLPNGIAIIYRNQNVDKVVNDVLSKLVDAYEAKSVDRFNSYISSSYQGDMSTLEEAIKSDFLTYDNINMDIVTPIIFKSGKNVEVNFDFYWRAVKKSDGSNVEPAKGNTSYTFTQEGGRYKLLAMKTPIIFGVSRASEVTTGTTGGQTNNTSTVFDEEDVSVTLTIHTVTLTDLQAVDFSTQTKTTQLEGDMYYEAAADALNQSTTALIEPVGTGTLENYTSTTKEPDHDGLVVEAGKVYIIKDNHSKYVLVEVTTLTAGTSVSLRYKYQSSGAKNFP